MLKYIKNMKDKLEFAIANHELEVKNIKEIADNEYKELKLISEELLKIILEKLKEDRKNNVKLQVNYGDRMPSKSSAYLIFNDIRGIYRVCLDFSDEMYRLIAYYIYKINNN